MTGGWEENHSGGVLRKNVSFMGGPVLDDPSLTPAQLAALEAGREIDPETGVFINQSLADDGIINTINRLRIQQYYFNSNRYGDCNSPGISVNEFLNSPAGGRQCSDWGNPISEIYIEALRYLTNRSAPTPAFDADDTFSLGLGPVAWDDPYELDVPCTSCSIIVLSTGLNNFDGVDLSSTPTNVNELSASQDLPNINTGVWTHTDDVGLQEGIVGNQFIIGDGGAGGASGVCDAKTVGDFHELQGLCPENPTLQGSYNIAGAAYYARTEDIRDDIEGEQHANTYTVSLSETLPSFEITARSGNSVSMMPMCQSNSNGGATTTSSGWRECSLVDLTVFEVNHDYGYYVIAWEDSPWGFDYDMDVYQVIEYCTATGTAAQIATLCPNTTEPSFLDEETNGGPYILSPAATGLGNGVDYRIYRSRPDWNATTSANDIQFRSSMIAASAGFSMKLGYALSGTVSDDGGDPNQILRNGGYDGGSDWLVNNGDTGYTIWSYQAKRVVASTNTPQLLNNPLWYAAKYGNFENTCAQGETVNCANDIPDRDVEWDRDGDGDPDAYFEVKNPALLPDALSDAFEDIGQRVSAGSAAAVNAQTGRGEGAIYQALYVPELEEDGETINWIGSLHGLFIDRAGRLRDDSGVTPGVLQDDDDVIVIEFLTNSDGDEEALLQKYDAVSGAAIGSPFPFDDSANFRPIWSAREQLNNIPDASLLQNRDYLSPANTGRFIFTSFDRDNDGQVIEPASDASSDVAQPFVASVFVDDVTASLNTVANYLAASRSIPSADADSVTDLVNFIRGQEGIDGFRSRSINYGQVDEQKYLLGDLIHSTPAVVGRPSERYHLPPFNDETYQAYIDSYEDRRNVVYIGANDGMLHAFNSGFFTPPSGSNDLTFSVTGPNSETEHPLGAELWAYVPFNLLPHLQWLAMPAYSHVYYVDGPVQAYDVNIFDADADHPFGWGTIIVASMRFGGGDFSLDHDGDTSTPSITTRSSYMIFDVTNPEEEPELLAEITDDQLGYTTALPTLVKYRKPAGGESGDYANTSRNAWYLVFGSGPQGSSALSQATSDDNPNVYIFDLEAKTLVSHSMSGVDEDESFIGGFTSADWNNDFEDDAVYFGIVGGTPLAPEGKLKRGVLSYTDAGVLSVDFGNDLFDEMSDPQFNRAFSAQPLTFRDSRGDRWVFAGTGRYFVPEDNISNQQQYYFGIKEPDTRDADGNLTLDETIDVGDLVDTSDVDVFEDGRVFDDPGATSGQNTLQLSAGSETNVTMTIFDEVTAFVRRHDGWYFEFENIDASDTSTFDTPNLAVRNTTRAALAGESLVLTAYEATLEFCETEGDGLLYSPAYHTGAPAPFAPAGVADNITIPNSDGSSDPVRRVLQGVTLAPGVPSAPVVTRSTELAPGEVDPGCDLYNVWIQSSTGVLGGERIGCNASSVGRNSWREIPVDFDWVSP
jgi:type IV pilus assembly protein PilY1